MNAAKKNLLIAVIQTIEETYSRYLHMEGLKDTPVTKVGFFVAAEKLAVDFLLFDADVYAELLKYLAYTKKTAMDDYLEAVELLLADTEKQRAARAFTDTAKKRAAMVAS
jgi:hypothetical protein